ncbi:MAG: hypothetical protein RIQ60_1865 [Pseudomonadota bacterium]|jgi:hypothetical protein
MSCNITQSSQRNLFGESRVGIVNVRRSITACARLAVTLTALLLLSDACNGAELGISSRKRIIPGPGEIELGVSETGNEIVLAVNGRGQDRTVSGRPTVWYSRDAGEAFSSAKLPVEMKEARDPTVTWTGVGKFYFATMGSKNARVAVSTDAGETFSYPECGLHNPTLCQPAAKCFGLSNCDTDQPHISGDRRRGQDQLYIVWRNKRTAHTHWHGYISCSVDGGVTWKNTKPLDEHQEPKDRRSDFPRIAVGPDGFVYVVAASAKTDSNIRLQRFSQCSDGLRPTWAINHKSRPLSVGNIKGVYCDVNNTVAGLDRCNSGNTLSSPSVSIDTTLSNTVYIAYATEITRGKHEVKLLTLTNWQNIGRIPGRDYPWNHSPTTRVQTVSSSQDGHKYLPWVCGGSGHAFVGWYDRRASRNGRVDATEYYVASSEVQNLSVSGLTDYPCDSGFPTGIRQLESDACGNDPMSGYCLPTICPSEDHNECIPTNNTNRCRFSINEDARKKQRDCGSMLHCSAPQKNRGSGNYGDYNSIACLNDTAYLAWASVVPPPESRQSTGLGVNFAKVHRVESQIGYAPHCDNCAQVQELCQGQPEGLESELQRDRRCAQLRLRCEQAFDSNKCLR